MFPALPDRDAVDFGGIAEAVHYLEGTGLLPLDAERVHGVHDDYRRASRQLPHYLEGNVEIAPHLQDLRPVHERLGQLSERDVTLGDEHRATHPGPCRVGRR